MLESLLEALKLSPNNIPLKYQIAKLLIQKGQFEESQNHLQDIINLDSNHLDAKFELANCFYKQNKLSAAEVLLEEILYNNQEVRFLELLCYCQIDQENYADAQQTYQSIIEIELAQADNGLNIS